MRTVELSRSPETRQFGPLQGKCCIMPGDSISGTLFFGGAGIDGSYIQSIVSEMHDAGISSAVFVDRDKWSGGTVLDALVGVRFAREYDPNFPLMLRANSRPGEQFNLVGYSYGSLLAAQVAAKYGLKGTTVHHLVLIGAPISQTFLNLLRKTPAIKKIIVMDLDEHGDPIYAGIPYHEVASSSPLLGYQMARQKGHFYYSVDGETGKRRHGELASYLYDQGLR
ncbi:alpha/beta fold hydrolase [Marinobacter sp. M1N3S26]|uniref:alpha/beta fold hydrolase n=1 Tax=Marinobacter sp. M1N3S26 TaxID=3382299 RepID=UPI00387B476E